MNRKMTGLAAAVALALVGTLVLVGYVRSAEARAVAGEKLVDVLVVTDKIEAGTKVADLADKVDTEQVPEKVRADGALTSLEGLDDKVAAVDLLPGEQLVAARLVAEGEQKRGDVPSGLSQITIELEAERALAGKLAPGDTVGVLASFEDLAGQPATDFMLHKVLVTGIQAGEIVDKDEDQRVMAVKAFFVTLALDSASAQKVVFAAEHGRVWLTAEPADAAPSELEMSRKDSVYA